MSKLFCAMLWYLLLHTFIIVEAEYTVRCSNETRSVSDSTVLEPSKDRVKGRYFLEWCVESNLAESSAKNNNFTEWEMLLSYSVIRNASNCQSLRGPTNHKHSEMTESFNWRDLNCTYMCFSTHLDLLFTACYVLENWLPAMGSRRDVKKQYIHNELTKESFTNNTVNADVISHDDYVSIHWHLGNITATKYNMSLIHKEFKEDMEVSINDQCSTNNLRSNEIVCMLSGLNGSYQMDLAHTAPWKVGDFGGKGFVYSYKRFEYQPRGVPAVASPRGVRAWAWACGVLAAACGALLACAAAARWRGAARFRKRVLDDWRQSRLSAEAAAGAPSPAPLPRPVLLLYARDGPPAAPLVAALTRLLELAAPEQVLDLFAPRTVALAAAAPHDWLREAFRREDVRVVLLQTPALACFYPTPYTATLEAPLLADEPEPGDALLALALRLLASAGDTHTPLPYTKYYLATVGELETETLPYTVPFRRYVLPADAERLLRDLLPRAASPPTAASSARAAVHSAADSFVRHAQRRPGYLRDQLRMAE